MREGWEYKKLGEVCHITMGQSPDGKSINDNEGVEFHQGKTCFGERTLGVSILFSNAPVKLAEAHSVLLCVRAPVGYPNITNRKICIGRGLCALYAKKDIDNTFLFYSLLGKQSHFEKNATGSTFKAISSKVISNTEIPLPPKSIQLAIVSELDKINELIRLKKEQLKDYDNLAQSIFYEMFGDPVENEKGWEVKKMKDVCTHIVDCPHSTPKKADTTTNYPCIRTSELKGGTISWSTMQYLEKDEYEKRIARLKPETGDIIFGREGTIGDAVILPSGYNFSLGQRTMLIRTDNEMIINTFMHRTLMSEWIKHQIEYVNVSSTVAHVNIKDFKLFDVPLPPLSLQHLFAQRIEQIERQKSAVQKSITDLETLLASRMQYWFE